MAAASASIFTSPRHSYGTTRSVASSNANQCVSKALASTFLGASVSRFTKTNRTVNINRKVTAAAVVATTPAEEIDVIKLPTWATFERGISPVYWKTMNGLPPTSGEKLKIFYNPSANKLAPNEEFGIAFNGGFNQPIMCGGEPRAMLMQARGKADDPLYTIQICVPKHAVNLIFSFTNGVDWDGPYRLTFQVPKPWRNRPIDFFNEVMKLKKLYTNLILLL
ncbi:hypothetical protein K2173_024640 [Erythroxylum novogranatense]|uniref:PIFI-like Ig-like domain-containing protein n=1 Tax=Erythroxylum novogranatense TaxID=1862640 RepID=A0AAV8SVZ9_9ROSI|nr:hypothetical protein K2173_024640 [Erythroxylum novogranatense]